MSSHTYSTSSFDGCDSWPKEDLLSETTDSNAVVWVPVLVPFWEYHIPNSFSYDDEFSLQNAAPYTGVGEGQFTDMGLPYQTLTQAEPSASCHASADTTESDTKSDASTDVGDDDDVNDALDDCDEELGHDSPQAPREVEPQRRPFFAKLNRQQRVDQLRRVTDEFCALNFNSVDASSQGAVSLRMLTILKSLRESSVFHDAQGKCEEQRLSLLGLGMEDEKAINDVICRAEESCENRLFRIAFDALQEVAPRLCRVTLPDSKQMRSAHAESGQAMPDARPTSPVESQVEEKMRAAAETTLKSKLVSATGKAIEEPTPLPKEMSAEDIEAMKQRRLEKRQRQRMERTEQRAADRSSRAAQRSKPSHGHSSSSSSAATWYAPKNSSSKGKRSYS